MLTLFPSNLPADEKTMFFKSPGEFRYDGGLLYCAGLRHANVHNTLELANTSMGFRTTDGRFFLAVAAVVFVFSFWVEAPPLNGFDGLVGSSLVMFSTWPTEIVELVKPGMTTLPSGLKNNSLP